MEFEPTLPGTNEVFLPDGTPRPVYRPLLEELGRTGPERWVENLRRAHGLLLEEQYRFGISRERGDKTHPTDWVPRLIPNDEWQRLERGLSQRLRAINAFLRNLEAGTEKVVPREVIESSILYDVGTQNRFGPVPVRQISFDIVAVESRKEGQTGGWEYIVIEENAKMPVGLAAMTRRRRMSQEIFFPDSYKDLPVYPLDGWLQKLGDALRAASPTVPPEDATLAVISSGPDDQFYLDHHIYAEEMDAILAETKDLRIDDGGYLVHRESGRRIDVIYERVDEDTLYAELPELLEAHVSGKVHVLLRAELGDHRRQRRLPVYTGDGPHLPRGRTAHREREDLVAGGPGGLRIRNEAFRGTGRKESGRLRRQGGHDRAGGVRGEHREVPQDG